MRLIDADAANVERIMCYYGDNCRIEDVQEWLDDQPTIDAAPVRRGEWINESTFVNDVRGARFVEIARCSLCGMAGANTRYCPHCGADMRGGKNETRQLV